MTGDVIATDKAKQLAAPKGPVPTTWFDGHKYLGLMGNLAQENGKS